MVKLSFCTLWLGSIKNKKMKILNKDELNEQLGKENFWQPQRLTGKVAYISGISPFDELLDGKLFTEVVALINFAYRPNGLQIEMMKGLKYYPIGLKSDRILSINLEDKEQIYEKKDKSIIGRAIIGGLILGPVGAVIGGMTGVGDKTVKAEMPDMILTIRYQLENKEQVILFSCKYKERKEIEKFLQQTYSDKFQLIPKDQKVEYKEADSKSLADEIKKLADLKLQGLITEEEFVEMKQKLMK